MRKAPIMTYEEFEEKVGSVILTDEGNCPVKEKISKEIERFKNPNSNVSENAVLRGYIATMLALPWVRKDLIAIITLRIIRLMKTLSKRPLIMNHWK